MEAKNRLLESEEHISSEISTVNLLGVRIHSLTVPQLHGYLCSIINAHKKALVLNVNVHCLNIAYECDWLRHFLNCAELVFCDGAGVMLGAWLLGHKIPERITYADWTWQLAKLAISRDFTLFFLGARPGIAEKATTKLREKFPSLKVGTHHGYFDKTRDSVENKKVINEINLAKPDILIVGFGMPLQEQWLMENWEDIDAKVALTGGAVFDYISGELQRGPRWMVDYGFEWLARLLIEPRRLWRRYIVGNPLFLWRVFKQKIGFDRF